MASETVEAAYRHCLNIAHGHYENFVVGSWFLPRSMQRHIAAIYAFARHADDLADEGSDSADERLAKLAAWEAELERCYGGVPNEPVFVALQQTIQHFAIPADPFRRLLSAFRSDVRFRPFATYDDLLAYCHDSADPVGQLVLYLFGYHDAHRQHLADQICSGLQLANFWQDISIDAAKGRVYLPLEDLQRFDCSADEILHHEPSPPLTRLICFEVERARQLLHAGSALADSVEKDLARELRLFVSGGLAILERIASQSVEVAQARPRLSISDKVRVVAASLTSMRSVMSPDLTAAYQRCQEITRRSSSNFYYAFRLLPLPRRQALFAVYAFCRFIDDIADDDTRRDPSQMLQRWRDELHAAFDGRPTHPIGVALADAARRFPLERQHFLDLIRGVEMDLSHRRYDTFDALYEYCYLVASTVGLLCIAIFGHRTDSARQFAVDLGIAFQLTNILRDVEEDARRGRIYLPLEDLRRFDCSEAVLMSGQYSNNVGALMAFECGRARAYYLRAAGALAPQDRLSLAPAEAMRSIYERLLDRIEARHFDVFEGRITLSAYEKLTLALTAWGRAQLPVRAS